MTIPTWEVTQTLPEYARNYGRLQFLRAYLLAREHHHAWAQALDERIVEACVFENATPAQFIAECHVSSQTAAVPWLDRDGSLQHSTSTGRLRWVIESDGRTTISVYRKSGLVLTGVLGSQDSDVPVYAPLGAYARHWFAIAKSVRAITPEWREGIPEHIARRLTAERPRSLVI